MADDDIIKRTLAKHYAEEPRVVHRGQNLPFVEYDDGSIGWGVPQTYYDLKDSWNQFTNAAEAARGIPHTAEESFPRRRDVGLAGAAVAGAGLGHLGLRGRLANSVAGAERAEASSGLPSHSVDAGRFDFTPGTPRSAEVGRSSLSYLPDDGMVELTALGTPQAYRGQGAATQAMQRFTGALDAAGLPSRLVARGDAGTDPTRLQGFYQAHGYEAPGPDGYMVRPPKTLFSNAPDAAPVGMLAATAAGKKGPKIGDTFEYRKGSGGGLFRIKKIYDDGSVDAEKFIDSRNEWAKSNWYIPADDLKDKFSANPPDAAPAGLLATEDEGWQPEFADGGSVQDRLKEYYPDVLTEKESERLAPPRAFPGDPSLYQGAIENLPERPVAGMGDKFTAANAEVLSPTMGGYGMGQLLAETYGHGQEGEWAKAAETGVPLVLGIFAGPGARTADLTMMARAQELAKTGAGRDAIWKETGWFQGKDGKWRFEIPDDKIGVNAIKDWMPKKEPGKPMMAPDYKTAYENLVAKSEGNAPVVGDMFHHDALDAAYPKGPMGTLLGTFDDPYTSGAVGLTHDGRKAVALNDKHLPSSAQSTLLHELQHLVQEKEGFGLGSQPMPTENLRRQTREENSRALQEAMDKYPQAAELFRARNRFQLGMDGPSDVNLSKLDAIDAELLSVPGGRLIDQLDWKRRSADSMPEEYWKEKSHDTYNRTAGEVEARNVQKRRLMSPEDRKLTPPWETEDVPSAQQILSEKYGGPQMSVGKDKVVSGNPSESAGALTPSQPSVPVETGRELREYARAVEDALGIGQADDFNWGERPLNFSEIRPTSRLDGAWMRKEIEHAREDGNLSRAAHLENMLANGINEPIIVSREPDGYAIWDGHHRVASAIARGETSLPAIVGEPRSPSPQSGSGEGTTPRGAGRLPELDIDNPSTVLSREYGEPPMGEADTVHPEWTNGAYKNSWKKGETAYFEYHCAQSDCSPDAPIWYRSQQPVEVLGVREKGMGRSIEDRVVNNGSPRVYQVRFRDGHVHDIFENELVTDPKFFQGAEYAAPDHAGQHVDLSKLAPFPRYSESKE